MKNWHIISDYKAKDGTILCVCGWFGNAGYDWLTHRKRMEGQPAPKGFNYKDHLYAPGNYPRTSKGNAKDAVRRASETQSELSTK